MDVMMRLCLMVLTGLLTALASLAGPATLRADPPAASQPDQAASDDLADQVALLGHHSYQVREQATERLGKLGIDQLDRLVPIYKAATQPEIRLRLRIVARDIFYNSKLSGEDPQGFLGINHTQEVIRVGDEQKLVESVHVMSVWPDSPAAQAGLAAEDRVIEVNGKPIANGSDGGFAGQVRDLPPGTKLKMKVVRGEQTLELTATLSSRRKFNVHDDVADWERQFETLWREKFEPEQQAAVRGRRILVPGANGQVVIEVFDGDGVIVDQQIVEPVPED